MRFSIVTPSFRSSAFLKLCIASVADQAVELEHIVQDAGSDDGTLDWLTADRRVKAFVEKDSGMYDAVNRGLRRASGEILAYLNCDEQHLPGALPAVSDYFDLHPGVDVIFSDCVVVDGAGKFICFRKVQLPTRHHIKVSHLPTFTCSTFFRRRIIDERGFYFDPEWRVIGDIQWMLRLLEARGFDGNPAAVHLGFCRYWKQSVPQRRSAAREADHVRFRPMVGEAVQVRPGVRASAAARPGRDLLPDAV